jgi:trans-aconitate 2-methyltransferase
MPRNHREPSHTSIAQAAAAGPWQARLARVSGIREVREPAAYYRLLAPLAARIDIWQCEYLQVLGPARAGEHPVVEWTKGTTLRPHLDALDEAGRRGFLAAYTEIVARAYPPEPDGRVLFPFRRLFIVAER